MKSPTTRLIKLAGYCLCLLLTLSACTILGGGAQEATPTPEPTSSIPNMQVISPQACQVAEQGIIRVDQSQGDLISWSQISDTVAYIADTE